jgi:sugar O-acyltransferase (sialic acid O-acetyltransferase NeuD family)
MRLYGIFGIGGLARETMPVCRSMLESRYPKGGYELVFVSNENLTPAQINGHRVMTEHEFYYCDASEKFFNIAINDSRLRESLVEMACCKAEPFSIIANSFSSGDASKVGAGAILLPFSSITSNANIGRYFHAGYYARVAHDCIIGDYVTFAPSVQCNGGVVIENHAYIGSGAVIKQSMPGRRIVIGEGAVIGMGAVVTKSVPAFTTVVGSPARLMSIM